MLGKRSDAAVAEALGITRNAVQDKRRQLDIPSVTERRIAAGWTPERLARLGQVPDRELAAEIGVHPFTVSAFRQRRGIPQNRV